jgi:hypothetical protein
MAACSRPRFPRARILILAKAPVPGACKTRLIPALGAEGAARLAEELLTTTVARVCDAGLAPVELWCAPDTRHPVFRRLAERFEVPLHTQRGGDLGERMSMAMSAALANADRAILIGTDCPGLDARYLDAALTALNKAPVVLGPADDGGYVLLGARRDAVSALHRLFAAMPWGSDAVAARTRKRLRVAGMDWTELPTLADIDRPEDLTLMGMGAAFDRMGPPRTI